jgi:hypothetical protein
MQDLWDWLENSPLGTSVGSTPYLYGTLESLHILGIALLVGPAFAFDLRLLGLGHRVLAVTAAARHLLPLARIGFAVAAVTGVALFSASAVGVSASRAAPWKLGLILIAGMNVAIFHRGAYRRVEQWNHAARTPLAARVAAVISASCWTGVIIAGRMLAYV